MAYSPDLFSDLEVWLHARNVRRGGELMMGVDILFVDSQATSIPATIEKEVALKIQEADGSWYGSWVICYTYATWFSLGGLARTGKTYENYLAMHEGVDFLQETNQQWRLGRKRYIELEGGRSNLVRTSWTLIGLIQTYQAERDIQPLHRVGKLIINSHLENRDHPQQEMTGVFMKNCILNYVTYK
ncbi:unnamed protein product [Brassica oleracea]